MFKKIFSLFIVLMLLMGTAVITAQAEDTDPTEAFEEESYEDTVAPVEPIPGENSIFFDPAGSGWEDFDSIGFHIWSIDDDAFSGFFWGSKKQKGKQAIDGRWFYDLDEAGLTILDGKQYGVIFYAIKDGATAQQTYNLIFGTACLGKTASCDSTIYENPEDSHKTTQAAFWEEGIDPTVYGPELQISSIGTVVGVCCPANNTPYQLFDNFLHNTLQNARIYAGKSDQQLLDDIAIALGLSRADVEKAIIESGLQIEWVKEKSAIPADEEPTAPAETETQAAGDDDNTVKSPQTGFDMTFTVILIGMALAAAGIVIARKKLTA